MQPAFKPVAVLTLVLGGAGCLAERLADPLQIHTLRRAPGGGIQLEIVPSGEPGEVLDVFVTDSLSSPNWRTAAKYLQVGDQTVLTWDEPPDAPTAPTGTRFFRIGRADIDRNENGIPDAREALFHVHDLPPQARARWAQAGLPAAVPDDSPVLNARDYGALGNGSTDDAPAINTLIAQAPPGSVVYLPAGVYRLTRTLYLKPDMILRGDGPTLTSLIFEGPATAGRCIGIIRWDGHQSTDYVQLAESVQAGSTELIVSSLGDIRPGDIVELEQDNDPAWGLNDTWQQRLPGQINRVTQVDASAGRVVLAHHLRHDFTPARQARLRRLYTIDNVGIEDLYLRRQDAVDGYSIEMKYAVNSWVRNVESELTYKSHVWMDRSFECEVRESYFHDAHVFGGGGQGYGVGCGRHTSDCLVENNIFRHLRHSMIVGIGANGNVFGYNHSTQRAIDPVHGTSQPDISVHGNYVFMNLFEGNVLEDADVPDWYWPAGPGNTLFRNRILNQGTAIDVGSNRQNLLGNVLPYGTITREADLEQVVEYGNIQLGDPTTANWDSCPCRNLADSFYRSVPPDFMLNAEGSLNWPPIGPDVTSDATAIPASLRFETGAYVPD